MKKSSIFVLGFALLAGTAVAQNAQEVTYVEDPSQGYLFNKFSSNWFIQAEGGVGMGFTTHDNNRNVGDRFTPSAKLYVGKWFSPILGLRIGGDFTSVKGVSKFGKTLGAQPWERLVKDEYYKTKVNYFGAAFDVMLSLTNWWCGYKPGRIYNAVLYVGAGGYFTYTKKSENDYKWGYADDDIMTLRAGLINSFNVSKQVQLSLDLRFSGLQGLQNEGGAGWNKKYGSLQAYLGVTYLFKKRDWTAPVVPICPEPENCDALRARLAAADARIADLEQQLKDCLNRPVETVVENNGPLATVYYPIGVSRLSRENQRVVKAIAYVMAQNPDKKYVVTGWADNYTGTDNINVRLRKNRAAGVEKLLLKNGVKESQLEVTTNNGNLSDLGEKCVALDRAVTIEEK